MDKTELTSGILAIIKRSGSITFEKILFALEPMVASYRLNRSNFNAHWRINYTARRLRNQGWIKLIKTADNAYYTLTAKGEKILSKYEFHNAVIRCPKRWDNKWRIIIFDIRERKRNSRDNIRAIFKKIGLVRLQNSVWIHPYPCEDIIELAKTAYHIRREVIYLVSQRFNGDDKLAFNFGVGLNPIE